MDIKEFSKVLRQDVHNFEDYWLEMQESCPTQFPIEFNYLHEWYDQFDAFTQVSD